MLRYSCRLSVLLPLLVLAACTSVQPLVAPEWTGRETALLALDNWEMRGRMAFKSGNEGGQARLEWQQAGHTSQIQLAGPFGAGAYNLLWGPQYVRLSDASGERSIEYSGAAAAEDFLNEQLGWSFPAGSLRYWVMGLLDPAAEGSVQYDQERQLANISQHGWDVQCEKFQDSDGYLLPTRISIENPGSRLKIVVSNWQLDALASQ